MYYALENIILMAKNNFDGTHSGSIGEQVMECYISTNLMKE